MVRYIRKYTEYDPKMMRALYGGGKRKDYTSPLDIHDEFTKSFIKQNATADVSINNKNVLDSSKSYRLVLYGDNVYSIEHSRGIHLTIIAWLILNKGLRISSAAFMDWAVMDPKDVGFLCLHTKGNEIFFSESYVKRQSGILAKSLNSIFKKQKSFLEKLGGIFNNKFYKGI